LEKNNLRIKNLKELKHSFLAYFSYSFIIFFLIILLLFIIGCSKKEDINLHYSQLTIYVNGNFVENRIWEDAIPIFEEIYDCHLNLIYFKSSFNAINQIIKENKKPQADVLIGIGNTYFNEVANDSIFISYKPYNIRYIPNKFTKDNKYYLIPYAYNYLAFIYDSEEIKEPLKSFGGMQDGKWKNNIIVLNPQFSSMGNGMLLWSIAAFNNNGYKHFWRSVKENIYSVRESWEDAYNMFLAKEAPIVLGFISMPIYHREIENSYQYKAFIPQEGEFRISRCAGIIKTTKKIKLSEQFIEFLLSTDFQNLLQAKGWMYPVNRKIKLKPDFLLIKNNRKELNNKLNIEDIKHNYLQWIKNWQKIMKKKV